MAVSKDYGRRLIPNIVDARARSDPERAVYSIPVSSAVESRGFEDISARGAVYSVPVSSNDVSSGFRDISARVFANAVNRIAWWLESELGKGSSFQAIGYIGPRMLLRESRQFGTNPAKLELDDIRYALLVLGCIKAGYQALLLSPRNSIEAILAVLKASDCNIWVLPKQQPKFLAQLLAQHPMKVLNIAEVDDVLQPEAVPDYAYNKTFDEASHEPFCVLHTSGSTGHPKPIFWKHSMLATLDATRLLPESSGRPPWVVIFEEGDRFYSAFPFFHSAAVTMNILINSFYGTCNVLGPANVTPSLGLIDSLLDHAKIRVWSIIPSIVDEIGESPAVHTKFKDSKIIIASGGPVSYASANKATQSVRVMNITGTTEGLFMGSLLPEREDWIYFSFHPYANFDFREIEPGVFEQWIVRDEKYVSKFQGIFHTFPDIKEMSLKDLFTAHPTKPGLWLYKGRTDDVVVLSNGNKIHPKDVEAIINSHPAVSACLVVGTGHFQAALLVELVNPEPESSKDRKALLDSIYETVQRTNASKPPYACITKEYIMFTKPHMPFARTDKNTVKRRATVVLHEKEIEEFYRELDNGNGTSFETAINAISPETTAQGVQDVITASLPLNEVIAFDDDLFLAGLDSVLTIRVAKCLRSAAEKYDMDREKKSALVPQLIYANPTINQLSAAFYKLVHNLKDSSDNLVEKQAQNMKDFRAKYTADLPRSPQKHSRQAPGDGNTVILTGSTGSLGSYLLESLVRQNNVKKIYCLNRAEEGMKKQAEVSKSRGLMTSWPTNRVHFLKVDLSKSKFGLDQEHYNDLLQQTTHIIHSQWPVNFNYGITSFEPQIQGVRELIEFCLTGKRAPSLFFVSTIATVSHLRNNGAVPETPTDVLTTAHGGYGASKQVCELILQDAFEKSELDAVICRVGQIAGPVMSAEKGMWAKQEWVPTIIASSKYLGVLPSTLGSMNLVDWIPVDILANIIVELAGTAEIRWPVNGAGGSHADGIKSIDVEPTSTIPVYHAVNPEESEWADLVPTVHRHLGQSVKIVSWGEWVDALSKSQHNDSPATLRQNPGLKLLDFFESLRRDEDSGQMLPSLDTERSTMRSGALAGLKPVGQEWMEIWLKQWDF